MNAPASGAEQAAATTISDVLARFASTLTFDAIPAAVRERAKYLILDAIGLAYASHGYRYEGVSLDALRSFGGQLFQCRASAKKLGLLGGHPGAEIRLQLLLRHVCILTASEL